MSKCPAAESTLQKCPFLHGKKKEEAEALENPDAATESDGKKRGGCPHLQGKPEAVGGDAAIKKYFAESYNKLSGHAMTRGDVDVAKVLANKLGYSEREIAVIGQDDLSNMMGTGNPHMHAGITAGDVVVDLGSGLGLDAFVAADKVGSSGRVIGVDLAKGEVQHATQRAQDRGVKNVEFQVGDMENLENIATGSVDVCISNGGFCLVPSKQKVRISSMCVCVLMCAFVVLESPALSLFIYRNLCCFSGCMSPSHIHTHTHTHTHTHAHTQYRLSLRCSAC
jgi:hypothetical protein